MSGESDLEKIKSLVRVPRTWLLLAFAIFGWIWSARINAEVSNLSIAIMASCLGFAFGLGSWAKSQPPLLNFLAIISPTVLSAMLVYHTPLWIKGSVLKTAGRVDSSLKPDGLVIGGIQWRSNFTEVHIVLLNDTTGDYSDLDLVLNCDAAVTKAGLVSEGIQCVITPDGLPSLFAQWVDPTLSRRINIPTELVATESGFRIRCGVLPGKSALDIVLAAVIVGGAKVDESLIVTTFSNGRRFWSASKNYSPEIFNGDSPKVTKVTIAGRFKAMNLENRVIREIAINDPVEQNLDQLKNLQPSPPVK